MNYRKKAIFVVMAMLCLNFSSAFAQAVSLKMEEVSVKEAMTQLKNKSGYSFVYEAGDLDTKRKVNVNATQLLDAVSQILEGQNVSFEIRDKNIVVSKDAKDVTKGKKKTIKGTVKDTKGEPIIGATVMIKGTSNGTITDFDSNFTLDVAQGEEIEISYIGYKTQIVKPGNRTVLSITLLEDAKILEEVVVVGYGKQSEKLLTTSISSMKVDDIDQGNDYNVAKMLQGRTPGVNVSTASGIPGEQPNVRVRGVASISGDATPLYVVDGVPSDNMPYLNPNDIERMDVLKDASATAIYGSRANNGVIIITTKSGKNDEKTRINASVRHSVGWVANDIEMANSDEYIRTISQAIINYNTQFAQQIAAGKKKTETFLIPDEIQETDWMSLLERDAAHTTNANINLSGGNKKTTFFASAGFNDQQGIIRKP